MIENVDDLIDFFYAGDLPWDRKEEAMLALYRACDWTVESFRRLERYLYLCVLRGLASHGGRR